MKKYEQLLLQNRAWVEQKLQEDKDFFNRLANVQTPEFLWIGCADSRVPANEITGTNPGEVFVHRNIANMVVHSDMNMLSVLDYAVNVLEVKHVIVCGHYGCGGIKAAMINKQIGLIDNWLEAIDDMKVRQDRLTELNVIEQVYDLGKTSIIQNAWQKRGGPYVHGWVYDVSNGLIKDLKVTMHDDSEMPDVYRFEKMTKV
jgi:carbonic anhydrase